jgi:hypothetical protein
MNTIIYPYRRIISREYLENKGFPAEFIDDALDHGQFNHFYQVAFPQRNLRVLGEKNSPLEAFIQRLGNWHNEEIVEPETIRIVQNSPDYQIMFAPGGAELGELEELDDEDYKIFVEGIQRLRANR